MGVLTDINLMMNDRGWVIWKQLFWNAQLGEMDS